jgi:carbon-monoxide dehydrogenase catalytic subunit
MSKYTSITADPAVEQLLEVAHEHGIETAFDRAEYIKPCPIGSDGVCCKICAMGPCRLVGKAKTGICGATVDTVVARNLARMIAAGSAAHSDHGRDMALALLAVAEGEAPDYHVRDIAKLVEVAHLMGIPVEGRETNAIAKDVAERALAQFGQQRGELEYLKRAPKKRQQIWRELNIAPRGKACIAHTLATTRTRSISWIMPCGRHWPTAGADPCCRPTSPTSCLAHPCR